MALYSIHNNQYKKESHKKVPKEKVDGKGKGNHPKAKDFEKTFVN